MTSSADKEHARRSEIEKAWVRPEPLVPAHAPEPDERPRNAQAVLAAIQGRGFDIQEFAATNYSLPVWRRADPDDVHLSYLTDPITVYKLAAARRDAKDGELAAIEIGYIAGKVTRSCIALGSPNPETGRWKPTNVPITQLPRTVREALA